jgi:fructose-6-phosphate aldolase 2
MIYMLDCANLEEIEKGIDLYPLAGVTTNPTIVTKEKRNFVDLLTEIRSVIGDDKMLHVQVISESFKNIVTESNFITEKFGENTYTKIPVTAEGIKAIKYLKEEYSSKITATAIFTPQQALMAAEAGADFVAPYVNRTENIGIDSSVIISDIIELFKVGKISDCKILGASFKNTAQVHNTILAGAESVTVSFETLEQLIYHPLTDISIEGFIKDWKNQYSSKRILA